MRQPDTLNEAGGAAFSLTPQLELVTLLSASFCTDGFYRDASSVMDQLVQLIQSGKLDPEFVAKAAIYARDTLNMRSITHVCAAAAARILSGRSWASNFYDKIVVRPDDAIEIAAFYAANLAEESEGKRKKYPAAMKKGFAKALARFDEYRLRKYKGQRGRFNLVDVMRVAHAKGPLMDKLSKGELSLANTWETRLSSGEDKAAVWSDLLKEGKLGYMALLKNLRNISSDCDEATKALALEQLVDPERIAKSRVLPFRFYTAYKTLQRDGVGSRDVLAAVSEACDKSCANINQVFEGPTLVAVDTSGSMTQQCAGSRVLSCMEAGLLFGAAIYKAIPNSDIMVWANHAEVIGINPRLPLVDIAEVAKRESGRVGCGTNLGSIFENADRARGYARFVIFSDMNSWWGSSPELARRHYGGLPWVHTFNLSSNSTSQFDLADMRTNKASHLCGFSEKVLTMISSIEEDPEVMLKAIEEVEL